MREDNARYAAVAVTPGTTVLPNNLYAQAAKPRSASMYCVNNVPFQVSLAYGGKGRYALGRRTRMTCIFVPLNTRQPCG